MLQMNIGINIPFGINIFGIVDKWSRMELPGWKENTDFGEIFQMFFPKRLDHIIVPPTVNGSEDSFYFLLSDQNLLFAEFLVLDHFHSSEVILHYCFNIHFCENHWWWSIFHMPFGHL